MIARLRFPMSELAARTGVPAATIHHYVRLGLLPRPERASANRFLYDERHEQGLRLIRTLRERRRLPLQMIRRMLPHLLGLEQGQAFRPEMWEQVMGRYFGRGGRRTPDARLLETAKDAFARRGYAAVNVDDLCRMARVAKGSFYRHFRSKEELFFAVCEAVGGEVAEAFAEEVGERMASTEQGVEILADLLEPRLPILLELVVGSLQRRPGYGTVARRVLGGLAHDLGGAARSQRHPREAGTALLHSALGRHIHGLIEPGRALVAPAAGRA